MKTGVLKTVRLFNLSHFQFHIPEFDPSFFPHPLREKQAKGCRKDELNYKDLDQYYRGILIGSHSLQGHDLTDETGGSHSGTCGIALHIDQQGADRTQYGAGENGREPYNRFSKNVWNLKHGRSDSLGQ